MQSEVENPFMSTLHNLLDAFVGWLKSEQFGELSELAFNRALRIILAL